MRRAFLILLAALGFLSGTAHSARAGEWEFSGFAGAEVRYFPESPAFADQKDVSASPSAILQLEVRYRWNGGDGRFVFIPFFRADADDEERTHADIRELNWQFSGDDWDLLLGFGKVFWGVTESRHLVDIVNQTDLVENLNQEDKLGQPMVNLTLLGDWGTLSLFVLPGFRERTFPAADARLRGPLPIDTNNAEFESGEKERHVDLAARYSHVLGDFDLGLSFFQGTSREPLLAPRLQGGRLVLVPVYNQIGQTGIDIQATLGAWLLKWEAIRQTGHGDSFFATVAGFEYTLAGILGSSAELGLLAEYLYDGRDEVTAPFTPFDDDVFVGMRLALNDEPGTTLLVGAIVDRDNGTTVVTIEADRRLGDGFKIELEANAFTNVPDQDPLRAFRRDGYLGLTLLAYF